MINKLEVKNFKCLKELNINLKKLNILSGINSSGKSSVVQTLLLIKQSIDQIPKLKESSELLETYSKINGLKSYVDSIELAGKVETISDDFLKVKSMINSFNQLQKIIDDFNFPLKKIQLKGDYIDAGQPKDLLYEEAYDDIIGFKLDYNDSNLRIDCDITNITQSDSIPCKVKLSGNKNINFYKDKSFQYLSADRVGPQNLYDFSLDVISNGNIGSRGEYFAHYLAENRHTDLFISNLICPGVESKQLLPNASAWLAKISNGISIDPEIMSDLQKVKLRYQYFNNSKKLFPKNIGFGISYVLPVIVSILKSKPGDLIIIENPESHLHPAGQTEIGKLCSIASNNGVQIIVETHSDHFLNGIRVAAKERMIQADDVEIYFFSRNHENLASKIDNPKMNQEGKISSWPIGFFDEWDNQLDKLLW